MAAAHTAGDDAQGAHGARGGHGLPTLRPDMDERERAALVAAANAQARGTIADALHLEITDAGYDFAEGRMPVAGNTQPAGLFHGGAHVVLAESLGSTHAFALAGGPVVGVDLNATHIRGARCGYVHGRAEVLHRGRTLMSHEVKMRDDEGRLLSIVRITNMVLERG